MTNFNNFALTTLSCLVQMSPFFSLKGLCIWCLISSLLCSSLNWRCFLISSCSNRCFFLFSSSLNCSWFSSFCLRCSSSSFFFPAVYISWVSCSSRPTLLTCIFIRHGSVFPHSSASLLSSKSFCSITLVFISCISSSFVTHSFCVSPSHVHFFLSVFHLFFVDLVHFTTRVPDTSARHEWHEGNTRNKSAKQVNHKPREPDTSATRMNECDTSATQTARVRHECYTNDTSMTRVLHKRHECGMSATWTTQVRSATRVRTYSHTPKLAVWQMKDYQGRKNFILRGVFHWQFLIAYIFSVPLKFRACYIMGQWGEFRVKIATISLHILFWHFCKNYILEMARSHAKMRLKSATQKLNFGIAKAFESLCQNNNIVFSKNYWKLGKMNARFWESIKIKVMPR